MKTSARFKCIKGILYAAVLAAATSVSLNAQVYWDQDSVTPPIDLEKGTFSFFADGSDPVLPPSGPDDPQSFPDNTFYDLEFSSSNVGTEAQTILLDGTFDGGTDYTVGGLIFNQGSISLLDDSSNPGSALDLGTTGTDSDGIVMNAAIPAIPPDPSDPGDPGTPGTPGPGDATVAPAIIHVADNQSWNNNSTATLTIGSATTAIEGEEGTTVKFAGTGTGAVHIAGVLSVNMNIDQESSTSTLYLDNVNNSGLIGLTIDQGTVVATAIGIDQAYGYADIGSTGGSYVTINLENGGTLTYQDPGRFSAPVDVTGSGTLNFAGDTELRWGADAVTGLTGDDTLTLGAGDDLDYTGFNQDTGVDTNVSQNIQHLVLSNGGRLIVGIDGQGLGLLTGISTVDVKGGYTLDFGSSGSASAAITLEDGSALEARNHIYYTYENGTDNPTSHNDPANVTLENVTLPIGGTITVGNDDYTGTGSITIPTAQVLTGTTTFLENGGGIATILSGNLTGDGGLLFEGNSNGYYSYEGTVYLNGTNSYSGSTILQFAPGTYDAPLVEINGDSTGIGNEIDVKAGILELGSNALLSPNAVITLGESTNQNLAAVEIGDGGTAANVTIHGLSIQTVSNTNNGNDHDADAIIGGPAGISQLTWQVDSGNTTYYSGTLGSTNYYYEGNGVFGSNNLELIKTGAGTLYLTDQDSTYSGGTIVNEGTLAIIGWANLNGDGSIYNSTLGIGAVTLNNGAALDVANQAGQLRNNITLGTKGTVTYSGDSYQAAGTIEGGGDYLVYSQFNTDGVTGDGDLVVGGGDLLAVTTTAGAPGNIYVVDGRLLMFNNTTFIDGATSVTVADGGNLDFGAGGSVSAAMPVYVGANGSITERAGTNNNPNGPSNVPTSVTISDLIPEVGTSGNTPVLNIGTDDVAGGSGSIHVTNQVNLTSNFQINGWEDDNNYTDTVFTGGFKGTGNLTIGSVYETTYPATTLNRGIIKITGTDVYKGDTTVVSGMLDLQGNNTGVTSATGGAPNYFVSGTTVAPGVYNPGLLLVGPGGSMASDANVTIGGSSAGQFGYFVLGDYSGAQNVTVGSITAGVGGGAIFNGDYADSTMETLTVNVAANTTDTYTGTIGSNPFSYDFNRTAEGNNILNNANQLSLVKSGSGTLALNGANNYVGTTTVNGGKLAINTFLNSGVTVNAGGEVGGSGYINGTISGAGAVGPGNSPGILTANQVNAGLTMSFNFEMTQAGEPTYNSATGSGNDVLHLISGMPFVSPLVVTNAVNIYFSTNGTYDGGFFVNGALNLEDQTAFAADVSAASYNYYVLDAAGNVTYNGEKYALASSLGGTVTMGTLGVTGAGFSVGGTVDGYEQQFELSGVVIPVEDVPEPSTYALILAGLTLVGFCLRRKLA